MALSKIAAEVKRLLRKVYGSYIKIVEELHLGEKLRLDFYLPDYGIGVEVHGRQHREFVEHFHKTAGGFRESKRRDARKHELCCEQDIALVVIWFDDDLTEELIQSRAKEALASFSPMESTAKKKYTEPADRKVIRLLKAKEARQQRYQWQKKLRAEKLEAAKDSQS
mgnify:CR=1 FL=1|tara:strand:+ start:1699 stop:2199 length:501 start_codon:yes stop_codon:yes gene_type:complete